MTRILKVNAFKPDAGQISLAARVIKSGGLVAFPTETVYGLGANAFNRNAVMNIFKAKRRPIDNPVIVHISDMEQLHRVASKVPKGLERIVKGIWPGPLTLLLYKSKSVPKEVCGNTQKVTVRMPAHPVALALIKASGVPIAAPSANISGRPSPTRAQHVVQDLKNRVDVILDAGETFFGLESTIIDATTKPYTLLRPGAFTLEELREKFGNIKVPKEIKEARESKAAIVPGMKYKHYAPSTPLYMINRNTLKRHPGILKRSDIGILCSSELFPGYDGGNPNVILLGSEKNPYEIARNLFDSFRKLDTLHVRLGVIQTFDQRGIGLAIMNRIKKASSFKGAKIEHKLLHVQKHS